MLFMLVKHVLELFLVDESALDGARSYSVDLDFCCLLHSRWLFLLVSFSIELCPCSASWPRPGSLRDAPRVEREAQEGLLLTESTLQWLAIIALTVCLDVWMTFDNVQLHLSQDIRDATRQIEHEIRMERQEI